MVTSQLVTQPVQIEGMWVKDRYLVWLHHMEIPHY